MLCSQGTPRHSSDHPTPIVRTLRTVSKSGTMTSTFETLRLRAGVVNGGDKCLEVIGT
ncbi:hypothetical protein ZHAS_00009048 [Anopheles sinensis]|uniref:Uncharacterized protein n=1 Tax=Anopheles sinensis TaxID=74873 RepID=A0A084VU05_ANOSI|nr:hypothetical protein ZHAS_00009048 [Anopheles sinensis]